MRRHFRVASGFTLIEMIITLCVFLLLAGAIFSIFGATLQSASELQDNQNREDSAQALAAWLRQSFLELPADGVLFSYHRDGQPMRVSGMIWGTGENLRAIDLRSQPNGNYELRLASYQADHKEKAPLRIAGLTGTTIPSAACGRFQTQILNGDASLIWRPLVRDLKTADWRFHFANSIDWTDSSAGKPLFAALTFQQAGMAGTVVDDFWIPPTQPVGNPVSPASAVSVNR